ncbi:site-specific DNA-methyltransferase [Pseudomonas syringae]|uniref:site-specific DNA-methyltransferase n=1 Tax=Pseudomonas syringae TaxID=317 RepID=UPI000465487B|nr:site-specific DNA-methyltransferase [Pseudomonas syringae]
MDRQETRYSHLSREELIGLLLKKDATQKLGLVWERDEIEHEKSLNDDFVVLELDEALSVGQAPFENVLVEADNFDALRYLHIAYKGKVKCIYIDPPYNTGNRDFLYNDSFVDKEDSYRHSKWLEFMYRRLLLAKDLLADDGAIFVSIDDIESAHLTLLMDKIFPGMRVGSFVWRRRSGANDEKEWFISADHEYVLCYANKGFSFDGHAKDWSKATDDGDKRGAWVDGPLNQGKDIRQRADSFYPILNPETDTHYPCDPDSVWRFATSARKAGKKIRSAFMEVLIEEKRIAWPANEETVAYTSKRQILDALLDGSAPHNLRVYERIAQYEAEVDQGTCDPRVLANIPPIEFWIGKKIGYGKPRYKRFTQDIKKDRKPVSTWIMPSSTKKTEKDCLDLEELTVLQTGFTSKGTSLLSQMVGNKDFPYPKPLSLIKALVAQATDGESGHIVLDFFAGSGTTGHAVMALNEEDQGNRSFILVSSTESSPSEPKKNVCRDVAAKRLNAAIGGYRYRTAKGPVVVEGLGGEFAYMRAQRVPRATLALDIRHDQIWMALQQMHAQAVSSYKADTKVQLLEGRDTEHDILYVANLDQSVMERLEERFDRTSKPCIIYSWQPGLIRQRFDFSHMQVEKIPDYLIERFGSVDL